MRLIQRRGALACYRSPSVEAAQDFRGVVKDDLMGQVSLQEGGMDFAPSLDQQRGDRLLTELMHQPMQINPPFGWALPESGSGT